MTVAELIEQLQDMPQDVIVSIAVGGEGAYWFVVEYSPKYNEVELYTT